MVIVEKKYNLYITPIVMCVIKTLKETLDKIIFIINDLKETINHFAKGTLQMDCICS